jgi:hypothetical protein
MSESVRLDDVAVCPSTEGCPKRWRRLCDTFKSFSCLPQGIVGDYFGLKFSKKSLDVIVFYPTDEFFEVLCCGIM